MDWSTCSGIPFSYRSSAMTASKAKSLDSGFPSTVASNPPALVRNYSLLARN